MDPARKDPGSRENPTIQIDRYEVYGKRQTRKRKRLKEISDG